MKNSNWFVAIPLLMIANIVLSVVNDFYPLLFLDSPVVEYLVMAAHLVFMVQVCLIILYYKQPRGLLYVYVASMLVWILELFLKFIPMSSMPMNYQSVYMVFSILNLVICIGQIIFSYLLPHNQLRFWFSLYHFSLLAGVFVSFFIIRMVGFNANWPYNIMPLLGNGILLAFFIQLLTIRRADENDDEIINPEDLLSRKDVE